MITKLNKKALDKLVTKSIFITSGGFVVAVAYDANHNELGRCSYVKHEDSYYNSIEDSWTTNPTNIFEWIEDSIRKRYPNSPIHNV